MLQHGTIGRPLAVGAMLLLMSAATSSTAGERRHEAPAAQAAGSAIVPFTIQVPDAVLSDLKARLARARWPDEIEDAGWRYGANVAYMKELVASGAIATTGAHRSAGSIGSSTSRPISTGSTFTSFTDGRSCRMRCRSSSFTAGPAPSWSSTRSSSR